MAARREVLNLYKQLHRTVQYVFENDINALVSARDKIHADFKQNQHVQSEVSVKELVTLGRDCQQVLLKQVVQAVRTDTGHYHVRIRPEHEKYDNTSYRNDITEEAYRMANKSGRKQCLEEAKEMKKDLY